MKNYYDILGLPSFEDRQDAILLSYKNGTTKLRAKVLDNISVEQQLIDLNEAFLVLSDKELKKQYDYCLSSNTENGTMAEAISVKRKKAEEFIHDKLSTAPKKRKKKWPAILCGFFIFLALVPFMNTCLQTMVQSQGASSEEIGVYRPSGNWSDYEIAGAFTISIPNTMELRNDYDQYTQMLRDNGLALSSADAVFQQANLSQLSSDAYNTYSRVLIEHYSFTPGEVERHNETSYIDPESRKNFREVVDGELGGGSYIDYPVFQWIDINGTKAIEAKYKRTGDKGPVICRLFLLPNYDEMVKIIVAYRESDSTKWASDLNNVIRTFKWHNPK